MSANYTKQITNKNNEEITVYAVNNDVNGNPRYVIHFVDIADTYETAHKKANKFGAKVYRAKWFGGGFVFQSYNLQNDVNLLTA